MAHVLLVEDDASIRTVLGQGLQSLGHTVRAVGNGADAVAVISSTGAGPRPEVMVLDLGLPDVDGSNVLAMSRLIGAVPVIVATARDDEREVIKLLDAGADDYLVKPFSAAQMDARIRAVLRRAASSDGTSGVLQVGELHLDPVRHVVRLDGAELTLTRKEFDLLHFLMQRPGEVVSKQVLLSEVWGLPWGGGDRTVDVHLSWLRRKLGESAAEPRYLFSVRGVGVKLVDPGRQRR